MGLSQTLTRAAGWTGSAPILHFVNLRETETDREQPVLFAHRPGARKAEPLAQPQHGFKPLDGAQAHARLPGAAVRGRRMRLCCLDQGSGLDLRRESGELSREGRGLPCPNRTAVSLKSFRMRPFVWSRRAVDP